MIRLNSRKSKLVFRKGFSPIATLLVVGLLALVLSVASPLLAQSNPTGVESILSLTVLPSPVTAGSTVSVIWDADVVDTGTVTFQVYVPSDWYSEADWETGNGVTVNTATGAAYTVASCPNLTIGGVPTYCARYSATDVGDITEYFELSFTVNAGATAGSSRPVRASNPVGSGGPPNASTIYVTVAGAPSTRYIGDTGCGGDTPCDTGAGALQTAVTALPASGGTIYVYGAHDSNGADIGTKNITLRPVDSGSSLNGLRTGCAGTLVELNSSGNLTVNGLTIVGEGSINASNTCFVGVGVTGSGNLTVQNGATFEGWYGNGSDGGYGVSVTGGSGTHSMSGATFEDNATGLNVEAATTTVSNSTFEANSDGSVMANFPGGALIIENSTLSNTDPGYGLFQYAGTVILRGNTFTGNSDYAFINGGGTMTAYANNVTGNNDGGYQASVDAAAEAAKNWWGSFSDPAVGPTSDGSNSYGDGWARRLGAPVDSWTAGNNSVTLGNAGLTGSGRAVIISHGRGSAYAPFANGIPPYVNRVCSDFYDFYALDNPTAWTVRLPIDTSAECVSNVRNYEIAFTIDPASYDTACASSNNSGCWNGLMKVISLSLAVICLSLGWI